MQKNKISFKEQRIFIGIDVHKTTWAVAILTESGVLKKHSQKASAKELFYFLKKHYPEGEYHAVYESGFTGFSTYYALKDLGINCIVIHAADVPTTQYEEVMKTDNIDAVKLAKSLRKGDLKSVYIREKENLDDRSVVRIRKTIQSDLCSYKSRIKHMLHCHGVDIPEKFNRSGSYWSKAFIKWLKEDVHLLSSSRLSLDLLIHQVEINRQSLLEATRAIRLLSKTDRYKTDFDLLMSIPGIGVLVSMCILTEIYNINRFNNEREFAHYLGLIPTCHNSGDKKSNGEKTFRGNKQLGPMIVEASWKAIRSDIGLGMAFSYYLKRMKQQEAIIRIARKLSNIIFSVLKNARPYESYCWDK